MPPKKKATTFTTDWQSRKATASALSTFMEAFTNEVGDGGRVTIGKSSKPLEVIPTGSMNLDLALGTGGWPLGRVMELWGPEHSGKTSLAMLAVASAQRAYPDKACAWVDMEQCLRQSEMVRLADGSRVPARDLVGEQFQVYTSTPEGHVVVDATAAFMKGESDIYCVTTESGRTIEVNAKHPLYRGIRGDRVSRHGVEVDGWTEVRDLVEGDLLAVPWRTEHVPVADVGLSAEQAAILGYLVGDGAITHRSSLTTPAGPMVDDFRRCVESLGDTVTQVEVGDRVASWNVRGGLDGNATTALLRSVGLYGLKSPERFIPDEIFRSSQHALAAFLGALYAADGSFYVGEPTKGQPNGLVRIEFDTSSEVLAKDVQEALLRFGVCSTVRMKRRPGSTSAFHSNHGLWTVQITQAGDQIRFVESIPVVGKQDKADLLAERARRIIERSTSTWRTGGLNPGLRWERVVSVDYVGRDRLVGLTVPGHHTYLSTFWEHNTFDETWAETLGVDLSRLVLVENPHSAEDVADAYKRMVMSGLFSLAVLDSIGSMISRVEFEKESDEATVAKVAQIVTRMVKQVAPMARSNGTCSMVINQVRSNIGGYGASDTTSGGWALKHITSVKCAVRRGESKSIRIDGKDTPVGHEVNVRIQKNKLAPHGRVGSFWLYNTRTADNLPGVDPIPEIVEVGKKVGIIEGSTYLTLPSGARLNGKAKTVEHLRDHPDEVEDISQRIKSSLAAVEADEPVEEDVDEETEAMIKFVSTPPFGEEEGS